jgi:hypothetical protein
MVKMEVLVHQDHQDPLEKKVVMDLQVHKAQKENQVGLVYQFLDLWEHQVVKETLGQKDQLDLLVVLVQMDPLEALDKWDHQGQLDLMVVKDL